MKKLAVFILNNVSGTISSLHMQLNSVEVALFSDNSGITEYNVYEVDGSYTIEEYDPNDGVWLEIASNIDQLELLGILNQASE